MRSKELKSSIRSIIIEVNGREIGAIKNGETKQFHLPPGAVLIRASLDRVCTSNSVEVQLTEGQDEAFKLSHKKGLALFNMIFDSKNYLILEKIKD
jgi:hypothetical protein